MKISPSEGGELGMGDIDREPISLYYTSVIFCLHHSHSDSSGPWPEVCNNLKH